MPSLFMLPGLAFLLSLLSHDANNNRSGSKRKILLADAPGNGCPHSFSHLSQIITNHKSLNVLITNTNTKNEGLSHSYLGLDDGLVHGSRSIEFTNRIANVCAHYGDSNKFSHSYPLQRVWHEQEGMHGEPSMWMAWTQPPMHFGMQIP